MKKKTRVLIISYTAALVAALAIGLIACRTDANRRQTAIYSDNQKVWKKSRNCDQSRNSGIYDQGDFANG